MRWASLLLILLAAAPASAQRDPGARAERARRLIARGEALLEAGDRGSAIAYFRDAVAADPVAPIGYLRLGQAYRGRGSLDDARAVLEAGLTHSPDSAELWLELTHTLMDRGEPEPAARAVRSLLARHPSHVEAMRLRARLARERAAWSEALTAYRALLATDALAETERAEAVRYERALRLLARPLDPVSAPRACEASPLRRLLARCPSGDGSN